MTYFSIRTTLLLFVLSSWQVSSSLIPREDKLCTNFTQVQVKYTKPSTKSFPISTGIVCKAQNGEECKVFANGTVTDNSVLNLTLSREDEDAVYKLVSNEIKLPWNRTVTGAAAKNDTFVVKSGQSGWIGFTPFLTCYDGFLSGCPEGSDIEDSTAISACTPSLSYGDTEPLRISGQGGFIATDEETAKNLTTNPADENSKDTNSSHGNDNNGSSHFKGTGAAWYAALTAAILTAGFML